MTPLAPSSFKGQLLLALMLSIGLKVLTFSLSTILTRLLLPYQNGVYFTFNVYNDAVLFIAREATRNVASRLPIIEPSAEAEDSAEQDGKGGAAHEMSPAERGRAPSAPSASSTRTPASLVSVANVRAVVSIAFCSVPLAIVVAAVVEALGTCLGAASFFPSMMQHARASQQVFRKAENASGLDGASTLTGLPFLLLPYMPETTVVLCAVLMAAVEPCVVLVQSLNLFRVVVLAECATLVARLCTIIGIVYACQRNSAGGRTPQGEVGNGLRTMWEARMALAFGQLAYAITHVIYYSLVLSGLPVARWLGSSTAMEQVRAAALLAHARDMGHSEQDIGPGRSAGDAKAAPSSALAAPLQAGRWATFAFPFCFYSIVDSVAVCRRYASLFSTFLRESLLRLVLSEGESLTLTSLGSETARGYYQLISSLGSLVARLLFRIWENACFVKWSREASLGHRHTAVQLLKLMLRLAFYVSFSFTLLGPPLAKTFLATMYTSRWATPQVSTALQLYFYDLPLMAWNGLLEAFLRAVASPAVLQRLQRWMVGETVLYIAACYVTLVAFGKADSQGESVSVLVLLNIFNTLWRCGVSIYLLVSSPGAAVGSATAASTDAQAKDGGGPAAPAAPSLAPPSPIVHLRDFASLFPKHIVGSILGIFVCSRVLRAYSVVTIAAVGLAYAAVILAWDGEVRQLLVTPVWSRVRPLLLGSHEGSHVGLATAPPRSVELPKSMAA
ncbi:putative dolichyl-P-Man:GDP-Man5GlcNAc2-PP-dolichyl alpha-1,2-mannosyltranslocase [Leishmania infantum JPCM5]|uniref:Protein RFT1 homolog n=2 Tax=Leishmania infantum TaxID=5671 RepID=A0A6L0XI96_LEIIN|nr:putative dolichyl-P-Man:GDP-Man5GlcNAc2-PP-dolichyl alpha-1,2-mannosyltranslocase [Leishmania infantum JPCM5]CAC9504987.1 dolichyl-lipid_chaperone_-_putative [Leishmania infantum]CAM69479.1 putative dolichyl-P-Man:GDP-Man5GlcNAc2-PP-dolichyl alpha-1,2-mannosyltranslocase [Leishmania infantum JPCM5]SUZ43422.1 dolichyl-lipid_chaperone_-_putative [Leishmania infantum]|eukprot:XP_001470284.1 putative dolichyl-P-Man:GDP-Man5GlcNAc2-PP-dolichyl alpha-1,2-mannosyltranslocase [Leishmania infantum JPCM5]